MLILPHINILTYLFGGIGKNTLIAKGYKAFAQSERNLIHGFYDEATKTTPLPHKKIAILAGLGWIGKSNLLVTQEYGSALCMCYRQSDMEKFRQTSLPNFYQY